jgi:hypothetical protein
LIGNDDIVISNNFDFLVFNSLKELIINNCKIQSDIRLGNAIQTAILNSSSLYKKNVEISSCYLKHFECNGLISPQTLSILLSSYQLVVLKLPSVSISYDFILWYFFPLSLMLLFLLFSSTID